MKNKYTLAIALMLSIVGLSMSARHGGRGHRGGRRGGRGWHRGGGGWGRRGYWGGRRGYWGGRRGYWRGYGPAVGFSVGTTPSTTVCSYARPDSSYYRYKREFQDPIRDRSGYQRWLKDTYTDWQSRWQQFQEYLDYLACKKSGSNVGVSFGIGTGYGYGRRGYWR